MPRAAFLSSIPLRASAIVNAFAPGTRLSNRWDELTELSADGLLAREEVEAIWKGLPKVSKSGAAFGGTEAACIDLRGFLEFDGRVRLSMSQCIHAFSLPASIVAGVDHRQVHAVKVLFFYLQQRVGMFYGPPFSQP